MIPNIDDLIPDYVRDALEHQRQLESTAKSMLSPVVAELASVRSQLAAIENIEKQYRAIIDSSERWAAALEIVQTELPKRGWYLTGKERGVLTEHLAKLVKEKKWTEIDDLLVRQANALAIKEDVYCEWLRQHRVPEHCINRVQRFLKARADGDHEVATLVGVPTIDEVSRAIYQGKDFTTKRNKQPKPGIACNTTTGKAPLNHYHEGFVDEFGLIHHEVDNNRTADEDYFNRHAIVHGLMRRSFGPKDSAKTFMALMFVTFAIQDSNEDT